MGVIYMYRSIGDYGSFADGLGAAYYFGRSKQAAFLDINLVGDEPKQKEIIVRHARCSGLNRPSRVLLWCRVLLLDLEEMWNRVRDNARGHIWRSVPDGQTRPLCTQQCVLGDNWFTVENVGSEEFGRWVRAVAKKERELVLEQWIRNFGDSVLSDEVMAQVRGDGGDGEGEHHGSFADGDGLQGEGGGLDDMGTRVTSATAKNPGRNPHQYC